MNTYSTWKLFSAVWKQQICKLKFSKCQFFKWHLHYVTHLISEQDIQPLLNTIITITNLAEPKNIDELHHFLGLTGYYRKFIPLFVDIMKSLNKLLRKDTKFNGLHNVSQYRNIWRMHSARNPSYSILTYISHTPCSQMQATMLILAFSLRAVDVPDDLRPIAYTLGSFSNMQQRWTATESEVFEVYQSVLTFSGWMDSTWDSECTSHGFESQCCQLAM